MVRGKNLKDSDIGGIASLCKAGHPNRYISDLTGISLRTVQHWTKTFRDNDFKEIEPLHKKYLGKQPKVGKMTIALLKREVDKSPRITARQLKERNPQLLSHVSVRTVRRILQRDLLYKYRCAWKKPSHTQKNDEQSKIF